MINNPIISVFFKDFTNYRKKNNRAVVFSCRLFTNILNYRDDETFQQSNQYQTPLTNQGFYDLFNHLGSYRKIMLFQIKSRRENRSRDTWIIKIRVARKVSANNFTLSDAEDNISKLLNRRSIAYLPLLRTLLAICQKFQEPSLMDSFALLAYVNLVASRTLLQWLLACINIILDSEELLCWHKWKKWFLQTMIEAQAAENHGDERGLTWYLQWGIIHKF